MIKARNGKTTEITNTDAEGRLGDHFSHYLIAEYFITNTFFFVEFLFFSRTELLFEFKIVFATIIYCFDFLFIPKIVN